MSDKWQDMKTLCDVAEELRLLDKQFVHDRDNCFARMATIIEAAILNIRDIDKTLRVDAAEYVPAIQDAFTLLDRFGLALKESEAGDE